MSEAAVQAVAPEQLRAWLDDPVRGAPVLLDVREEWEFEFCALADSVLIPLGELPAGLSRLDPEQDVVCICHHGIRSQRAAALLAQRGFDKVYNLTGGVDAWAKRVDPSMPTY